MSNKLAGLLWFDNDPHKEWRQKLREAAQRYQQKFWFTANLGHISPKEVGLNLGLNDQQYVETIDGIEVYASTYTQPHHFWVTRVVTPDPENAKNTPESATQLTLFGQ
jgi:hypothetical protein